MGVMNFGFNESNTTVLNTMTNITEQKCVANCSSTNNGNFVVIRNSSVGGDVNISNQSCKADASCAMTSSQTLTNDVNLTNTTNTKFTNVTDLFGDFDPQLNVGAGITKTTLNNSLTSVQSSTCAANSTNSNSGNFVYVSNASAGGNFNAFNQEGDATANCIMSATSNMQNYNKVKTSSDNETTSIGMMAIAMVVLVIGVLAIGGIFLFLYLSGSISSNGSSKPNNDCDYTSVDCNSCDSYLTDEPCPKCLPDSITRCRPTKSILQSATEGLEGAKSLSGTLSDTTNKLSSDFNNTDFSGFSNLFS